MSDYDDDDEGQAYEWNPENEKEDYNSANIFTALNGFFSYAKEASITKREIARYKAMRDVAITEITKKYEAINKSFEERRVVIEKYFEVIDKGIETKNYDLVNKGLENITSVVKDNPFKIFQVTTAPQRRQMLEDGDLSIE